MERWNDLGAVPWVAPEFYAARWPELAAENKVLYLPFLAVDPTYHRTSVLSTHLIREVIARVVVECDIRTLASKNLANSGPDTPRPA